MTFDAALRALVEARIGVVIGAGAPRVSPLVEARTARLGLPDLHAYVALLARTATDEGEWRWLLDTLLNGQTWFFRHPGQLEALGDVLAALAVRDGGVDVWVAACSTGEEAYSVAIVMEERAIPGRVLASDVSPAALEAARVGVYDEHSLRAVPPSIRARYFLRREATFEVAPALRARIELRAHNLLDSPPCPTRSPAWHAILCRNVLIYFEQARAEETVRRLVSGLDSEGALILGPAEALVVDPSLRARDVRGQVLFGARSAAGPSPAALAHPARADTAVRARGSVVEAPITAARREEADLDLDAVRRLERALALVRSGQSDAAVPDLRAVLFLEPRCWPASFLLASIMRHRGELGEASVLYRRTLDLLGARGTTTSLECAMAAIHEVDPVQVEEACRKMLTALSGRASP